MPANIDRVDSFPAEVKRAFDTWRASNSHSNCESIPFDQWRRMHFFLDDPALKPENKADRNLKHKALTEFELIDN